MRKANVSKVVSKESKEAKRAELEYEVLKTMYAGEGENDPVTLVKIHLLTRKTSPDTGAVCFPQSAVTGRHEIWRTDGSRLPDGLQKSGKPLIQRYEIALCAYALTVEGKI